MSEMRIEQNTDNRIKNENAKRGIIPTMIIGICIVLSAVSLAVGLFMFRSNREHAIAATGSASVDFTSDLVKWTGSFSVESPSSREAYAQIQRDLVIVKKFLAENEVTDDEVQFSAVRISEKTRNIYDENGKYINEESDGYRLTQNVQITSEDIDKVEKVQREISTLLEQGIEINSYNCEYFYTGINDLKLDLIQAATENARDRVAIIAGVSGANIGRLKNSSLGVVQITAINSGTSEYSYDGCNNTSSRDKTASVTVKLEYDLK
jgi:hypothetical protein